jgi:hypothetical protein
MTHLRFSIRDLLWLTLLCSVLVAWWIDHRRLDDPAIEFSSWSEHRDVFLENRRTNEAWVKKEAIGLMSINENLDRN